jgi:exosortase D (VPLPA-CTERM-specific)
MSEKKKFIDGYGVKIAILLVLFIAAYWVPLKSMALTWYKNEDYSYGFMIPLISAFLLWERRRELSELPIGSSMGVLPLLAAFVLLSLYGILGSSGNIAMPATPIVFLLVFAFCFGVEAARRLVLPLGFLFFMVPIPGFVERTIGIYLKSVSSKLGGKLIQMMGQTVYVSGNIIDLGVTKLQVVDACNGLRYIFPLLALGILYAYFFEKVPWKRIFCVLATIPIAILTNTLRIAITGLLIPQFGTEVAEGFFHGFSGWLIFLVAFAFLILLGRILRLFPPPQPVEAVTAPAADPQEGAALPARSNITRAFSISAAILVVVAALSLSTGSLPPVNIHGGIAGFPLAFVGWQGQSQLVDPEIIEESGAEEAFSGIYRSVGAGEVVSLYMGYRSTAFLATENFFHSPTVCLPASGLEVLEESTHIIAGVPHFNELTVSKMVIESMGDRQLVYFWFQTKDQTSHDKNINRFHLAMHAIKRDNTYDLFIRPITPIGRSETIESAEKRLDEFVREMMESLFKFLEEKQVMGGSVLG